MSDNSAGKSSRAGEDRANRLAQALRENLKRRKAQARGRAGSGRMAGEAAAPAGGQDVGSAPVSGPDQAQD